ncbi:MAG: Lrp/AsnC family transcriptional regulator [Deltaproteobacteria bacterium]|nr:Lrp/AsnC family transcriptional regulator [Deltaproteobacteria bacterium]
MGGKEDKGDKIAKGGALGPRDRLLIHALSGDLPLCPRPFQEIGSSLGMSEEEVLEALEGYRRKGLLRRFGAVIVHQASGFAANAMLVWRLSDEEAQSVGESFAKLPYVTHCYLREVAPGWPYNLYTMIHAKDRERLLGMAEEMARLSGTTDWLILESVRELKKESIRYFPDSEKGKG